MKIDIVYTWVNGNDSIWKEKKRKKAEEIGKIIPEANSEALYTDNNELKYSLRSVEKFAPWVNQIYIVTDNQIPKWLNLDHPKIKIVDHSEIFTNKEHLPSFSARAIECHLHNIKTLEEYYIYFNDDMFLGTHCQPNYFYTSDGKPYIFTSELYAFPNKKLFDLSKRDKYRRNSHQAAICNTRVLLKEKINKSVYIRLRHGVKPLKKSLMKMVAETFNYEIADTSKNSLRTYNDILPIHLFAFYTKAKNLSKTKYLITSDIKKSKIDLFSKLYNKFTFGFINLHENDIQEHLERILNAKPFIFCLNQTPETSQENIKYEKQFLYNYFPEKSSFEK